MNNIKEKEQLTVNFEITSILPVLSDDMIKDEQDLEGEILSRLSFAKYEKDTDRNEVLFVETNNLKDIGKTKALVIFAKEYNYNVLEPSTIDINYLKNTYDYDKIFSIDTYNFELNDKIVIDEGIDVKKIPNKSRNEKLITGFINSIVQYPSQECRESLVENLIYDYFLDSYNKPMKNPICLKLQKDLKETLNKINKTLQEENSTKIEELKDRKLIYLNEEINKLQKHLDYVNNDINELKRKKQFFQSIYTDLLK